MNIGGEDIIPPLYNSPLLFYFFFTLLSNKKGQFDL